MQKQLTEERNPRLAHDGTAVSDAEMKAILRHISNKSFLGVDGLHGITAFPSVTQSHPSNAACWLITRAVLEVMEQLGASESILWYSKTNCYQIVLSARALIFTDTFAWLNKPRE